MRTSNYVLGGAVIGAGLLLIQIDGPRYNPRTRSEYYPQLFGIALIILGAWTVIKEYIRRRRERRP